MNARITHEKAPERLMNKPNLGMLCAIIPDITIIIVRKIMFFRYGKSYCSNGFPVFTKQLAFSDMSNVGTIYIGKVPSKPKQ